jgi:pSer/pThr/pTyr-binding forkhead associated (FHA) protein
MEVNLIVTAGKNAGQKISVAGPKFFIGRAEDCNLRPHSDLISRHHCAILVEEGYVAVRDFGSKNGTFVNGERVRAEQELKNGDRLKVGPLDFDVELTVAVGGKKKPKVHSVQEAAARAAEVAGKSGPELDLSSMFGDESAPTDTHTETKTLESTKAELGAGSKTKSYSQPAAEEKKDDTSKKPNLQAHKKQSESTRKAAEDVLKQLFRRP